MSKTIKVTISTGSGQDAAQQEPQGPQYPKPVTKIKGIFRKTVDGNVIVYDHPDMDIVISPTTFKITTFPKKFLNDIVYDSQKKYFDYLRRNGVIINDSIQGGNVYGALEATFPEESNFTNPFEMVLFATTKFIEQEKPERAFVDKVMDKEKEKLVDPVADDTTELGEVPHASKKGAMSTYYAPYSNTYKTLEESHQFGGDSIVESLYALLDEATINEDWNKVIEAKQMIGKFAGMEAIIRETYDKFKLSNNLIDIGTLWKNSGRSNPDDFKKYMKLLAEVNKISVWPGQGLANALPETKEVAFDHDGFKVTLVKFN